MIVKKLEKEEVVKNSRLYAYTWSIRTDIDLPITIKLRHKVVLRIVAFSDWLTNSYSCETKHKYLYLGEFYPFRCLRTLLICNGHIVSKYLVGVIVIVEVGLCPAYHTEHSRVCFPLGTSRGKVVCGYHHNNLV